MSLGLVKPGDEGSRVCTLASNTIIACTRSFNGVIRNLDRLVTLVLQMKITVATV